MEILTEDELLLTKEELLFFIELSDEEGYIREELRQKVERAKKDRQVKKSKVYKGNVSKSFKKFRKLNLVYFIDDIDKQEARHSRGSEFFYIGPKKPASPEEKLDVFKIILKSSLENLESDLQKKLLASKYVNSLIAACGLLSFHEIIEEYMERKEFRRIASHALLRQPALIEEYACIPASMKENIESNAKRMENFTFYLSNNKYLNILFEFDPMEAAEFYREHLADIFIELYKDLTDNEITRSTNPYITESIKEFMKLDIYLSPRTSFPQNNPINLLFAKPFERLYDDVYICDDSDYEKVAKRAHIIYSNFSEVIKLGITSMRSAEDYDERLTKFLAKSEDGLKETQKFNFIRLLRKDLFANKQNLNNLIKELIFYWNIASLRLDFIYCRQRYWKDKWSLSATGYHLLANSNGIQAIKIGEDKRGTGPEMTSEDIAITSLWSGESDPFSTLRYCYCFKDLNLKEKQTSVEEIASALESIY